MAKNTISDKIWDKLQPCTKFCTKLFFIEIGHEFPKDPDTSVENLSCRIFLKCMEEKKSEQKKFLEKIAMIQEYETKKNEESVHLSSYVAKKRIAKLLDQNDAVLKHFTLSLLRNGGKITEENTMTLTATKLIKKRRLNLVQASKMMHHSLIKYFEKSFNMLRGHS